MIIRTTSLLIAIFSSSLCFSQSPKNEEALITDRPDATESPTTTGSGNFQIETGSSFSKSGDDEFETKETVFNTTLLRYGLNETIEIRLGWDFLNAKVTRPENQLSDVSGVNPLLLGAKFELVNEKGWLPQIGLLTHLRLPFTATKEFKPENTGMEMIFSFNHSFSEKAGLGYNLGTRIADDRSIEYLYTLSFGYSFTEKLGAYLEVYGAFPENTQSSHLWDGGLTYLINNNFQLDATIGTGLGGDTNQNLLISGGLSYRILKNK